MDGMSKWITDRRPRMEDATSEGDVWVYDIDDTEEYLIRNYIEVKEGQPWMEIPPPPNYVRPQRYRVSEVSHRNGKYAVYDNEDGLMCSLHLPTREAAERIAAIYEEVMP